MKTHPSSGATRWFLPLLIAGLAGAAALQAQTIPNASLEEPPLAASGKSFVAAPEELLVTQSKWGWGYGCGICQQQVAYAEGIDAAEGTQVAFMQGDPRVAEVPPGTPALVIGVEISGLTEGNEYELQWAEASRTADVSYGALTVSLTDPLRPGASILLVEDSPVENKGEWKIQKHQFTASGPVVQINYQHSIPELNSEATGGESTLIDDLQIRSVVK